MIFHFGNWNTPGQALSGSPLFLSTAKLLARSSSVSLTLWGRSERLLPSPRLPFLPLCTLKMRRSTSKMVQSYVRTAFNPYACWPAEQETPRLPATLLLLLKSGSDRRNTSCLRCVCTPIDAYSSFAHFLPHPSLSQLHAHLRCCCLKVASL